MNDSGDAAEDEEDKYNYYECKYSIQCYYMTDLVFWVNVELLRTNKTELMFITGKSCALQFSTYK